MCTRAPPAYKKIVGGLKFIRRLWPRRLATEVRPRARDPSFGRPRGAEYDGVFFNINPINQSEPGQNQTTPFSWRASRVGPPGLTGLGPPDHGVHARDGHARRLGVDPGTTGDLRAVPHLTYTREAGKKKGWHAAMRRPLPGAQSDRAVTHPSRRLNLPIDPEESHNHIIPPQSPLGNGIGHLAVDTSPK